MLFYIKRAKLFGSQFLIGFLGEGTETMRTKLDVHQFPYLKVDVSPLTVCSLFHPFLSMMQMRLQFIQHVISGLQLLFY